MLRAIVEHCEKCLARFTKLYADASLPPTAAPTPSRLQAASTSASASPPSRTALELLLRLYELALSLARAFERDYLRPLTLTLSSGGLSLPPPSLPSSSPVAVVPAGDPLGAAASASATTTTTSKPSSSQSSASYLQSWSPPAAPFAQLVKNSVLVCMGGVTSKILDRLINLLVTCLKSKLFVVLFITIIEMRTYLQ